MEEHEETSAEGLVREAVPLVVQVISSWITQLERLFNALVAVRSPSISWFLLLAARATTLPPTFTVPARKARRFHQGKGEGGRDAVEQVPRPVVGVGKSAYFCI